jgi:hydrogenase maturation factor
MKTIEDLDVRGSESRVAEPLAAAAFSLASRFASGATMWCVAPQWLSHGRHVAVEFVHPVIVGKRALPAVSVEGPDLSGAMRLLARPGDVLLAVSSADEPRVGDLMRRSEAWGLTSIWLGAGPTRPAAVADHVIWLDSPDPVVAARSGEVVLLYHLLWELTHVVLEHPGLLEEDPSREDDICITCSDEGVVAEVRSLRGAHEAEVIAAGRIESIDPSLVGPVAQGDLLLVHAGVALANLTGGTGPSSGTAR